MEIYIGNNRLSVLKEVQQLKELPKLIILDLSGNPLCDGADYRNYTIYQLRKLKVLDGVGIESGEQKEKCATGRVSDTGPAAAHAQPHTVAGPLHHAGKLSTDALVEKIGHNFWEHVRELDLSRSKRASSTR